MTIGLFYGSLQSTDGSNFPTRGREGEGGGGGDAAESRHFLFFHRFVLMSSPLKLVNQ